MEDIESPSITTVARAAIQSKDIQALHECVDKCGRNEFWLPSSSGVSLLELAVEENFVSAVKYFFSKVPSGPPYNNVVTQAFVLAMRNDFKDIIKLFLDGALSGQWEMTLFDIFMHAVHKEQEDIAMQVLGRSDFDLNGDDLWDGEHLLSVVIFKHRLHLAELLVNGGAIIDASNNRGETALVAACGQQFMDCCRMLLLHGANPNHHPLLGLSPLRACCSYTKDLQKSEDMVSLLLHAGLNVNHESWIQTAPIGDLEFYESLKDLGRQPQSLKLLSCLRIRVHMTIVHRGVSILNFLTKLPLPLPLKNYVTLCSENLFMSDFNMRSCAF